MMFGWTMWDQGEELETVVIVEPKDVSEMIQGSVYCTAVQEDRNCSNCSVVAMISS